MYTPSSTLVVAFSLFAFPLSGTALAQNHAFTPAGTRYWGGNYNNTWPFSGASARYQQIHDAVDVAATNGRRPLVIRGISFRPGGISPIVARQWDVQLTLGHTSVSSATITNSFTANFTTTPTLVLPYKSVSVPAAPAGSTTAANPIAWTIPFAAVFPYVPALGNLCWEWQSKNATSTTTFMDASKLPTAEAPQIAPAYGTGCTASGRSQPAAATLAPVASNFEASLTNGPANAGAILWVGLRRDETTVPGWCAPFYLLPSIAVSGSTDSTGTWKAGSVPVVSLHVTPYAEVYLQFGFADSTLPGGVGLSNLGIITTRPNQASYVTRMASSITSGQGYENATTGTVYANSGLVTIFEIL
ncbi:MAG: hypothetical protein KDC87_15175 [Planctomycetes bacterium]|nr:hypothetical protein [Planctomycetota bacterium]MCB9871795.1 hypothetical protein [Planctomycetota bacterium]MCB9889698.1 hypothetical protein [Planctomycetota bacterium]